jgi:hypothetical protein
MAEELPDWLAEASEPEPEHSTSSESAKPKPKPRTPKAEPVSSTKPVLSPVQLAILGGLGLTLCGVLTGIGGVIFFARDSLFGAPAPQVAAVPVQASTAPPPTPEPTATINPSPTTVLPEAAATPEPTPTATYAVAPEFINKDKIRDVTGFVEQWRELSLPEPLPLEFLTRRQLQEQWRAEAFDQAAIEAVETQQEFYRAMGLIEANVDLGEAAFEGQTDSLLGYYAPDEKTMYIISESVNMFAQEEMTFAHEYVHALQDHHFDLGTFLDQEASADALLAARSLPEGDARLIEDMFTFENITQEQLDYTVYRYLFQEHPQIEGVSPALGIFTYFPYTAGEYFVIYLFIEGNYSWQMVNEAYRRPPVSSEQVMHPEKYLAGELPTPVTLPDLTQALGESWREIDRDVLGEAGFLVWLIDQVDEQVAIDGAAGWEGDSYTLWVDDAGHRLLTELSRWETETDAVELVEAFSTYMDLRGEESRAYEEAGVRYWEDDAGLTLLSRQERQVLIIVAPDRATLDLVRVKFAGF